MSNEMQLETININLNIIGDVLLSIAQIVSDIAKAVSEKVNAVVTPSADGGQKSPFEGFLKSLKTMGTLGKSLAGVFKSVAGSFAPLLLLAPLIGAFTEPLSLITDPLETIGTILSTILYPILMPFNDLLYLFADAIQGGMDQLEPFFPMIQLVAQFIADVLLGKIIWFIITIQAKIQLFIDIIMAIWDLFTGKINIVEFLERIWNAIITYFTTLLQAILNIFAGIWGRIVAFLEALGINLVDWFKNLPALIMDAITGAGATIKTSITNWWESVWSE